MAGGILIEVKSETGNSTGRRSLRRLYWLGILGGWLMLTLFTTAQYYFLGRQRGDEASFLTNLMLMAAIWIFWAAAAPLVFWLARSIPLQRGKLTWALTHLFIAIVFGLLHLLFWSGTVMIFERLQNGVTTRFSILFLNLSQYLLYVEVILYWGILGAAVAILALRQSRERELKTQALESQLQQAQLLALKQQLHPHFLFNSLNTVSMLVRNGESHQAVQMIAGLGELLRWSLNEQTDHEVRLAIELETARRYLAIEQFRFPDRLRVEFNVPDELMDASVPNLILQPLVENAVRHGIARLSSASLIRIRAERKAATLEILVEDDGKGFAAGWQAGLGLENTRERLARVYGTEAELIIGQSETRGASVRLRLPFRTRTSGESNGKDQDANRG